MSFAMTPTGEAEFEFSYLKKIFFQCNMFCRASVIREISYVYFGSGRQGVPVQQPQTSG